MTNDEALERFNILKKHTERDCDYELCTIAITAIEENKKLKKITNEYMQDNDRLRACVVDMDEEIIAEERYQDLLDEVKQAREEIKQNAYPIVHGANNHDMGMTLNGIFQVLDKLIAESEG